MRDFSIDLIWAKIQVAITAIGGWIGWFLGGVDGMLIALIVLMALDYLSGVMCAIVDKKLSSAIGFKGICKKVLILMLVGVANIIDTHVVGSGAALRGAVICFYLSNEGLSLLETPPTLDCRSLTSSARSLPSCTNAPRRKEKKNRPMRVEANNLRPLFLIGDEADA